MNLEPQTLINVEDDMEYTYPHDDISAACNALWAVAEYDEKLGSATQARKIRAIKRYAINIIHTQLKSINDDLFSEEEDEETED